MEQLIPIASKLQDVLGALGQTTSLDLPQIVVVGGQSSGKSSVLESLVGRSFLPRGTGIVTRRPLILQLYNTSGECQAFVDETMKGGKDKQREWGEFLHMPGRKFFDFNQIRLEIVAETERLTGKNKGIDHQPINLKIFSPHVLALTLVDLPGVAKVPVGDQPDNIEQQIHEMCLQYIGNPNAIIIAVTSANTDLANSDALKMAQAVDPSGNRTIGVLTKLDLMDPGTDCADILMNLVIPLRRGYIAVVNRGQKDVQSDLSIREGLKKEEKFFRTHPIYSRDRNLLAKCGTPRLAKTLNSILMHHIRDTLPDLKARIAHMLCDVQTELDALGGPARNNDRSARGAALLSLISKFSTNFGLVLDGHGAKDVAASNKNNASRSELFGGARISYIFTEIFSSSLFDVGAFDSLSDEEIRTTICNANGTRPSLFVPEISFDLLVRRQIARLEQPGIQAVDLVYEELQRIASQSEPSELTRFPVLRDRMLEVVSDLLRRCVNPTQLMVSNLVKIELAYINTSHPDFIGGSRAVARLMEKVGKENDRAREARMKQACKTIGAVPTPLSPSNHANNHFADARERLDIDEPMASSPKTDAGGIMDFIFKGNTHASNKHSNNKSGGQENTPGCPPTVVHLPQVPQTMKHTDVPPTDRERIEMDIIKSLLSSYFEIVRKNYTDLVPKVTNVVVCLAAFGGLVVVNLFHPAGKQVTDSHLLIPFFSL